jgi:hypothetical protein
MTTTFPRTIRRALFAGMAASALVLGTSACDLDVTNPEVIDAATFDPSSDATTLSLSAQTNTYAALSSAASYAAFLSDEAWVGAVRQETNDFGRRVITAANLDINPSVWAPLSLAIASNEKVLQVVAASPTAGSDINAARAALHSGYALELMAEYFCQGAMLVGPAMTPAQTLDSAIVRFKRAVAVGTAAGSSDEAVRIVNAANVGLARAYLQKGENASAASAAALVPSDFVFNALYVNASDAGIRDRVGNAIYGSTAANSFVVPDAYRALNDPRVPYLDADRNSQDGKLALFVQTKYAGFDAPIRMSSGLEARYILAEAKLEQGDASDALVLVAERRAANGQPAFTGTGSAEVLAELMDQRARDFWLEGKHLGDWRRNPTATPYVDPAGSPFYKPSQGAFGNISCIPVPNEEVLSNPNFAHP